MRPVLRIQLLNLVLLVVAALMVVAVIITGPMVTTSERRSREDNLLVVFDEAALKRISIERDARKLVLVRDRSVDAADADWHLVEPASDQPDPEAVQNLIGSLKYATVVRRIPAGEVEVARFGLDAPRAIVGLDLGRVTYRLLLGKPAPAPPGAAYVEVTGDGIPEAGVAVVRQDLVEQLEIDFNRLRARQLTPYLATALRGMRLRRAGDSVKLRVRGGEWRFDGMRRGLLVDHEVFDRIAIDLSRAKALHFLEVEQAERLQRGTDTVTVTQLPKQDGLPEAVVTFGGSCPEHEDGVVAVRSQPTRAAACVPQTVWAALQTPTEQLLAKGLFTLRLDEIERVDVNVAGRRLQLVRDEDGFLMREPKQARVALEVGNQRLEAMLRLRGELLQPQAGAELTAESARGKLTLSSSRAQSDVSAEQTVLIGKPSADGRVRVRRELDGAVLELQREAATVLEPDTTLLRSLQVLDFSTHDVREVQVEFDGSRQQFVRSEDGALKLLEPVGHNIDSAQASVLLSTLASLAAERWVADADDGSFGLAEPSLRCRVVLSSGDGGRVQHELVVGRATGGGAYAQLLGDPGVFVLPRAALETLQTWLLDRSIFVVRPDEPRALTLQSETERIQLVRVGDRFVQQAGGTRLSGGAVEGIVQALGAMRAEAALHVGPPKSEEGLDKPVLTVTVDRPADSPRPRRWRVGAGDSWRGISVYYARAEGVNATYVIARSKVREILNAF